MMQAGVGAARVGRGGLPRDGAARGVWLMAGLRTPVSPPAYRSRSYTIVSGMYVLRTNVCIVS